MPGARFNASPITTAASSSGRVPRNVPPGAFPIAVRTAETKRPPRFQLPPAGPVQGTGPTVVELDGATCFVGAGWAGERDGGGTLVLNRA